MGNVLHWGDLSEKMKIENNDVPKKSHGNCNVLRLLADTDSGDSKIFFLLKF